MNIKIYTRYSEKRQQELAVQTGENVPDNRTFELDLGALTPALRERLLYKAGEFWQTVSGFGGGMLDANGNLRLTGAHKGMSGLWADFPLIWDKEEAPTPEEFEQLFWETEAAAKRTLEQRRLDNLNKELQTLRDKLKEAERRQREAAAARDEQEERADKYEEVLREIYRINEDAGPGSRRAVRDAIKAAVEIDESEEEDN